MNAEKLLTGVINTDNVTYAFHLNEYCLLLLDNRVNTRTFSTLVPVDGFAQAMTHGGHKVLMHVGNNNITLCNTMRINLSSFIVSTTNVLDYDLSYFDGIELVGGTLQNLKTPTSLVIDYNSEDGRKYIDHTSDTQRVSFSTSDFTCQVAIGSSTSQHQGLAGVSIANERIHFEMMFDKPQATSSVYMHYNKVHELLSFLVNRCNVGADEIYLLQTDKDRPHIVYRVAQVYIKREHELTSKAIFDNLEFEMLGDSLGNLMHILYTPEEHPLSIYPLNDKTSTLVSNDMVRGVCSALECELNFVEEIDSDEADKIERLVKSIKQVIREHRKGEDRLQEKTYGVIHGSMSHWSMSASDRIKALYQMYHVEMAILNESRHTIGDDEIQAFVKYRNQITHGTYCVFEPTIAYTTHLLAGLVYCCVLSRIGISREDIIQWCSDKRLNN